MSDKAISELVRASIITGTDLFVLQQDNTAKCLPGQVLLNWLTAAADGHGGIADWKKIGTSGLVDTYRVTLADTTTFDYYVTNGKAISSVKQTSVSGLTRTYTIAFNDETTQQFTVTDGRGILSVEQTSVSGLTRTYTISFNDGTTKTFTITDGRSFVRMEKTGTNGLMDTYTIFCNDGSTETITVTNGEKGDKGDRADIWVRYASQKPTESSHNFGELPDTWIGIATGHNMDAAPTDWKAYDWFQWKGEKGDTGDPAVRLSVTTAYQVGDAGNIIPSGSWLPSIPYVAPGKYLWIRKTTVWNKGDPDVDYSVSRMGIDGTGAVSTVAGVGPDANGNVPLTAADVKALSIGGGIMEGPINMNGQPVRGLSAPTENDQAANMGFVNQQMKKAAPRNLLDNSDFKIAQAGYLGLHGTVQYIADRWIASSITSVQMGINGLSVSSKDAYGYFYQKVDGVAGKRLTFAAKGVSSGRIMIRVMDVGLSVDYGATHFANDIGLVVCTIPTDTNTISVMVYPDYDNEGENATIEWVALYNGEYTAETLPEYQPKEFAVEFMECQRYDIEFGHINHHLGASNVYSHEVHFPVKMRLDNPSVIIKSVLGAVGYISVWDGSQWVDYAAVADNVNARGCTIKTFGIPDNSALEYILSVNAEL